MTYIVLKAPLNSNQPTNQHLYSEVSTYLMMIVNWHFRQFWQGNKG